MRNFFFLPMRAMPRELGEKYDIRSESCLGTLKSDYSPTTSTEMLPKEESKRTLKSLVCFFKR